jgi:hybrid cluster-associated redox disulfide protein
VNSKKINTKKAVKEKELITQNTMIAEVVERWPEVAEILTEDYGFHCVSCFAAEMETIGMGAMGHGMTDEEIEQMLGVINKIASKKSSK